MKTLRKTEYCLNCGKNVRDCNYCPECGQLNADKHVKLKYFFEDFLGDWLTFDSKFFRSIVPLIKKPGFLTNEYTKGRRVNYILPLRLYLFVVFVFFLLFTLKISLVEIPNSVKTEEITVQHVLMEHVPEVDLPEDKLAKINSGYRIIKKISFAKNRIPESVRNTWLEDFIKKKLSKFNEKTQLEGGGVFVEEMANQVPKALFILLPFFALILKLVYVRQKILYVKHLVFALHIHTLFFLVFILIIIHDEWYIFCFCFIVCVAYAYMAFRKVYEQSVLKTLMKMFAVYGSYLLLFPFALLFIAIWSIAAA